MQCTFIFFLGPSVLPQPAYQIPLLPLRTNQYQYSKSVLYKHQIQFAKPQSSPGEVLEARWVQIEQFIYRALELICHPVCPLYFSISELRGNTETRQGRNPSQRPKFTLHMIRPSVSVLTQFSNVTRTEFSSLRQSVHCSWTAEEFVKHTTQAQSGS